MKHLKLGILAALLAASTVACGGNADNNNGDTDQTTSPTPTETTDDTTGALDVSVVDNEFEPDELTVAVGDTVTWTWENTQVPHNVHSDEGGFTSETTADSGTTFEHTFQEAGTFGYICQVHPTEMTGTITVE